MPKLDKNAGAKENYVKWLQLGNSANRQMAGFPTTKTEFAEKYGISRMALNKWERDPDFRAMVVNAAFDFFSPEDISAIMAALKVKALDGNTTAAKMVLEIAGVMGKFRNDMQTKEDEEELDMSSLSDKELALLLGDDDDKQEAEDSSLEGAPVEKVK